MIDLGQFFTQLLAPLAEQIEPFHFLRPAWLLLLIPVISGVVYLRKFAQPGAISNRSIARHLLPALTVSGGDNHWCNPVNAGVLVLALSVLLMAGPAWQRQATPFVEDQAVLVIALDLSNTMSQTDIQPSRLERAKQKIIDLLALRGNARTGLIAYSGSAHQVLPPSNDPEIIRQFLAALDSSMMPTPGKFPEKIIPLAQQMLSQVSTEPNAPGTLLLIGDGMAPDTLTQFERFFETAPYQLIVLGIGLTELEEGAAVDGQFGGAHLALQEEALGALADTAGGKYLSVTPDKSDVRRINRLIDQHLSVADQSDRPWKDIGYYLLYPIALIFLLWFRRGWTLNACLALCFISAVQIAPPAAAQAQEAAQVRETAQARKAAQAQNPAIAQEQNKFLGSKPGPHSLFDTIEDEFLNLWLTPDQQGRFYFERGDYARSAQRFDDPAWKGMAFYYAENFAASAEMFRQIDSPAGRFNLANALAQGQHYVQAVKVYAQVLGENPEHAGALKNSKLVQTIIDDINRMSASQQTEQGEASRELGDAPQRADGAERGDIAADQTQQITADQLLVDEQIYQMWMRQIQAEPKRFLRAKFQLQQNRRNENNPESGNPESVSAESAIPAGSSSQNGNSKDSSSKESSGE